MTRLAAVMASPTSGQDPASGQDMTAGLGAVGEAVPADRVASLVAGLDPGILSGVAQA
jgi:hypothetical protein